MSKTIHAGTTPADDKVIVRIVDLAVVESTESTRLGSRLTVNLTALKALSLAQELIHAANAVLEQEGNTK